MPGFFVSFDLRPIIYFLAVMKEILKYSNCFICGEKNIHGVKARFFYDGEKAFTEVEASEKFEGYRGIYHGGVVASLLDEVMIKAILALDVFAVTREMTVKYLKPVRVGDKLKFSGKVIKTKGRLFMTEGEVSDDSGNIYASASGKYIEAKDDLRETLLKSTD